MSDKILKIYMPRLVYHNNEDILFRPVPIRKELELSIFFVHVPFFKKVEVLAPRHKTTTYVFEEINMI